VLRAVMTESAPALPGQLMPLSIRTNRLRPVPGLEEAADDPERAAAPRAWGLPAEPAAA
jgi:hypothetical protein